MYSTNITKQLDINRSLGISMGIVNIVTMSVYDNNYKKYDEIELNDRIIYSESIIRFKKQMRNRKAKMLHMAKIQKHIKDHYNIVAKQDINFKLKALNEKIKKFKVNNNNNIANHVVNFAYKNNCGVIQMEDLRTLPLNTKERFLKEWDYFNLQEQIEHKANQKNIKINYINMKNLLCDDKYKVEQQVYKQFNNIDDFHIYVSESIALPNICK